MKMDKIYHIVLLPIAGGIMHSFITINGSNFSDLSKAESQKVKSYTCAIDSVKNDSNMYKVTAKRIDTYIKGRNDVQIYEYLPFCKNTILLAEKNKYATIRNETA